MLREKGLRPAFLGLYGLLLFCRRCVGAGQPGTTSTQAMGRGKKPKSSGTEGSEPVFRSWLTPGRQLGRPVCGGQRAWLAQVGPGFLDI